MVRRVLIFMRLIWVILLSDCCIFSGGFKWFFFLIVLCGNLGSGKSLVVCVLWECFGYGLVWVE